MVLSVAGTIFPGINISVPFRMHLSGSSQSGKTTFAKELLLRDDLLERSIVSIRYYYPCYLYDAPVDWHNVLCLRIVDMSSKLRPQQCIYGQERT